jgi:predicted ATPase/DNA-binding SARP family transcriptional activator
MCRSVSRLALPVSGSAKRRLWRVASPSIERLPVRRAPLVGRQDELREVLDTLSRSRLVTLTGPGGTGKTRLALAAAAAAAPLFAAGVRWVELAPVSDPAIVAQEVAGRLGVPESPGQDIQAAIAEHVGDAAMLVVLDNCEHLTNAVASLADQLLTVCGSLSILATSREVLGVEDEQNWPVPPLSVPEDGLTPAVSRLAEFDAVKLFEQRAQATLPSFRLTDENATAVMQVCVRLDGLPLAIELAAARMRVLSAGQLAERLDDVLGVLVGGTRMAPARHQALRATLDWSYDLLEDSERAVFRRLAVFAGGFTLSAAEQVASGGDIRPEQMLDLLARLADKSLLQVEHTASGARYQLLVTVREYARERLAASGEEEQARQAHLTCYARLVERLAPKIERGGNGPDELERELNVLDAEQPNLRAALDFARVRHDAVAALRLAGPLGRYAYLRGHYHEVRQWMDGAVAASGETPASLRATALLGSGRLALLQCDYVPAVRRLEAALRLYRELDDSHGIASTLQVLGSVAREQGRYARALELHAESLATADAAGDRWGTASAHSYLGFARWLQRDWDNATTECTTALQMFRDLGDAEGIAWSLISLGAIARYQGDRDRAAQLLTESRSIAERIGFREGIAWSLEQLGLLALDADEPAAADLLHGSLDIHHELRDRWRVCSVLEDLAALALAGGRADEAAALLALADTTRTSIGTIVAPAERPLHDQTAAGVEASLGADAFAAAWQRGLTSHVEEVLAGALPDAGQRSAPDAGPSGRSRLPTAEPQLRVQGASVPAQRPAPEHAAGRRRHPAGTAEPAGSTDGGPDSGTALRIRALGAATVHRGLVAVTAADWGYAKPRELFFLLLTSQPQTKEQLGTALWPDLPPERLANALHSALRGVRRALGDAGWVQYQDGRYWFDSERPHECDVETFEHSLAAARRARPAESALPDLQRAIAAYGGEFLAGMSCGDWAQVRRDELDRSFESALLATGRLHAAAGRFQQAAVAFRRAVAHEPLNETAHRELMTCWARLGETARAVRHYEDLVRLLRDQVGVAPAAETSALYKRLTQTS